MPEVDIWRQEFEPTRLKPDQRIAMLDVQDIPVPLDFTTKLPAHIVSLAPGGWGGNHRHLSREVYVALNDGLYLIWRDSDGQHHEASMTHVANKFLAFGMPPYLPHMIENRSEREAILYELVEINDGPLEQLEGKDSLR